MLREDKVMARKAIMLLCTLGILLLTLTPVQADPIPGSPNELLNPGFDDGIKDWGSDGDVKWFPDEGAVGTNRYGKGTLFQVVDDSKNPLWKDYYNCKIVDLTASVKFGGDGKISLRLGYWNLKPENEPTGDPDVYTKWVTYEEEDFPDGKFHEVNPFSRITWNWQPKWIKLEVSFDADSDQKIEVDDLKLTAKCVPLPSSVLFLLSGLTGIGLLRRQKTH